MLARAILSENWHITLQCKHRIKGRSGFSCKEVAKYFCPRLKVPLISGYLHIRDRLTNNRSANGLTLHLRMAWQTSCDDLGGYAASQSEVPQELVTLDGRQSPKL